jgi:hypothetical protein
MMNAHKITRTLIATALLSLGLTAHATELPGRPHRHFQR